MDLGCVYPNQGPKIMSSFETFPTYFKVQGAFSEREDYLLLVLRQVKMPVFGASKMRVMRGVL